MDGECIDFVLDQIIQSDEKKQQLKSIRNNGMRGKLDLQTSLEQRIAYFKGLSVYQLENICQTLPWILNAKKTITELKQRDYLTLCLSGAFRTATRRVIHDLGVDAYCCNTLEIKDGLLTGKISGALKHHHSKGNMLAMIQQELGISPQHTIAVGDGANDLSMFAHANKKIAFCAETVVIEQANCVIENKDLSEVLGFID
ncbi:UNVERIFIED_CONTAM: hypothetical protein GTU68_022779 [Idotea baltica]|nr:hypothetical protein [Idotea baltica]